MNNNIIYEQPTNEIIRLLMKLEYLLSKYKFHYSQTSIWSIKEAINTLFEFTELSSRNNIKLVLLKEISLSKDLLVKLEQNGYIDENTFKKYNLILSEQENKIHQLKDNIFNKILENEFALSIKNKAYFPAGDNFFDLPSYLNFLTFNKNKIYTSLDMWFENYPVINDTINAILELKRRSSSFEECVAVDGFYEVNYDKNLNLEIIRIKMDKDMNVYPIVSLNNRKISILFKMLASQDLISKKISNDISFSYSCIFKI